MLGPFAVGQAAQQRLKMADMLGGDTVHSGDPELLIDRIGQGNDAGLPGDQLDGGAHDDAQHVAQVQLGGERPANRQQIFPFQNAVIE